MKNTIAIFINIVILIASLFTSTNYSIADTQTYNQTEISSDVGMYSYESSDEKMKKRYLSLLNLLLIEKKLIVLVVRQDIFTRQNLLLKLLKQTLTLKKQM